MPKPKISVLTPVLNGEKYIAEMLDSIVAQTFSDWEVVLMDGASKDNTLSIANRYAETHPNIRIFSELDESPFHALTKAFAKAEGEYMIIVCASDRLEPHWLERCMAVFEKDPEVSLVWGIPFAMTEGGKPIGPHFAYARFLEGAPSRTLLLKEIVGKIFHPTSLLRMVKRINRSNLNFIKEVARGGASPQKKDWFWYWLETGAFFPDGNMCVAKKVFRECLIPYRPGTLESKTGDWAGFSFSFNVKGYLSSCIPVAANFSRRDTGPQQSTNRYQRYINIIQKNYSRRLSAFRKEINAHPERAMVFHDRKGNPII